MSQTAAATDFACRRVPRGALAVACLLLAASVSAMPGESVAARLADPFAGAPQAPRPGLSKVAPDESSYSRTPRMPLLLAAGGRWTFQDGPTIYETTDGLGFIFADADDRAAKERVIARVHAEFRRLVAAVASAERGGHKVDYDLLEVREAGQGEQRVILVPGGPGVSVSLPLLVRSPEMVALARPWIRARVRGVAYRQIFPRADLLLPGVL